ncbi:KpsF/GutQ family sugar-phosphate isomerase [Candidatus Pelagibacter sp.]|nr:KpsF/GutQ family sugar-phosphate isomerase [Candidatus Pelagibacter sp.]
MNKYKKIAKNVIDLQISGLKKLKKNIHTSFDDAVEVLARCQSKVILAGVGKSGLIASKIASTLSSVGAPAFSISANDCSHGDLGSITKKDVLILISNSGNSLELKNIIEYANRYKIKLICIVSKKNSMLYRLSDIKLLVPESKEAGFGIVPTTSTTLQLCIGDALAIAVMKYKKFSHLDFKKFHPAGNLGLRLKTVEDLMLKKDKIPFINENQTINEGLKIIDAKKLGVLIAINNRKITTGIFTDGDIKRAIKKKVAVNENSIKNYMTKNPISIEKDTLAVKALNIMNEKKITCLSVFKKGNKKKTIGIIHIHNILSSNIN